MAYKVLNTFKEKEHDNHIYEEGHIYPAEGYKADEKRVEFLQKKHEEYDVKFLETPKVKDSKGESNKESDKKTKETSKKSDDKK